MDRLKALLQTINVTYSEKIFESDEGIAGLGDEPFDPDARIFIIATYAIHARPLLCEVGRTSGWERCCRLQLTIYTEYIIIQRPWHYLYSLCSHFLRVHVAIICLYSCSFRLFPLRVRDRISSVLALAIVVALVITVHFII